MPEKVYGSAWAGNTAFVSDESKIHMRELFGLTCGNCGQDSGFRFSLGLLLLDTNIGRFEDDAFTVAEQTLDDAGLRIVWTAGDGRLRVESVWTWDEPAGIWSRRDRLSNQSDEPVIIHKCLARFAFTPDKYEIYSQDSRWCAENQGNWRTLDHGKLILESQQARTCQGNTPYVFLRDIQRRRGVAFHILPKGNWAIRVKSEPHWHHGAPSAVVELGQGLECLHWTLAAHASMDLPEILIQAGPEGEPHAAAPRLHDYLLRHQFASGQKAIAPVFYNTWMDWYDYIPVERLRGQLQAAREIGCEVFIIDDGWFGAGEGERSAQLGDWRERLNGALRGELKAFADEVRAAGLGFGLWMEPERLSANVPVVKAHPQWFLKNGLQCYPDLGNPEAYAHTQGEIRRVIQTYDLRWLKLDFNHQMGTDASGSEFYNHYQHWYRLLDELRAEFPQTFFDGCASGGMRSDISTLTHFDDHCISDNSCPSEMLRIHQGAALRLLPNRLLQWTCLRAAGVHLTEYGVPPEKTKPSYLVPSAVSFQWSTCNLDFAVRANIPAVLGFSGDLAALPAVAHARLREHVEFYKRWREMIRGAVTHLLTPPELKENQTGWVGLQLRHPKDKTSLLFAYRLNDASESRRFVLECLDPEQRYRVRNIDQQDSRVLSGSELMTEGLTVATSNGVWGSYTAVIVEVTPAA